LVIYRDVVVIIKCSVVEDVAADSILADAHSARRQAATSRAAPLAMKRRRVLSDSSPRVTRGLKLVLKALAVNRADLKAFTERQNELNVVCSTNLRVSHLLF